MLFAVGSLSGAPGASSLARGLVAVWPSTTAHRVVVEMDPDGGRLAAQLGLTSEHGVGALASRTRSGGFTVADVLASSSPVGEWSVVCGPPAMDEAASVSGFVAQRLGHALHADRDGWWVIDAGRLTQRSPVTALVPVADETLLVSSGLAPDLMLVPARVDALRATGANVSLVIVGSSVWPAAEISAFAECDVLAVLPRVRSVPSDVMMSARVWRPWWSSVAALADVLTARVGQGATR